VLSVGGVPLGPLPAALSPTLLGAAVHAAFQGDLPFLLKVLSIRTALSIQVHPDRDQAQVLHAAWPDVYKDANHKPELAVALTPFEGTPSHIHSHTARQQHAHTPAHVHPHTQERKHAHMIITIREAHVHAHKHEHRPRHFG
jgi:mannose-6-phosphate isomerase class I